MNQGNWAEGDKEFDPRIQAENCIQERNHHGSPKQHTDGSHVIDIGTFGSHDPPKAFFLGRTVGFVQVSLSVTVHHTPFAVQHTETVPGGLTMFKEAA